MTSKQYHWKWVDTHFGGRNINIFEGRNHIATAFTEAAAKKLITALQHSNTTGRDKMLEQLDDVTKLEDFLEWVADRLEYVYHDTPRIDFILSLRKRAKAARELRTPAPEKL